MNWKNQAPRMAAAPTAAITIAASAMGSVRSEFGSAQAICHGSEIVLPRRCRYGRGTQGVDRLHGLA